VKRSKSGGTQNTIPRGSPGSQPSKPLFRKHVLKRVENREEDVAFELSE
jgi:hypothetical protein